MSNLGPYLAFNKEWFEKHQRLLLWLLNNPVTKYLSRCILRIHKDCPDKSIVEILPNCYTVFERWLDERTVQVTTDFRTHPKFGKRIYYAFRPLWWTLHGWDWAFADRFAPKWSFGFSTLTAFPDPDPETTTVDGRVARFPAGESWATIRAGAGTQALPTNALLFSPYGSIASPSTWDGLARTITLFDTSSIGSGATVSAATLSISVNAVSDIGSQSIAIVASTPASNTDLVNADYGQLGSTRLATDITITTISGHSVDAYTDFALNASGIAAISKTSITKLGQRLSGDVDNSEPSMGGSPLQVYIKTNMADTSGTSTDPKLVVTYSTGIFTRNIFAIQAVNRAASF